MFFFLCSSYSSVLNLIVVNFKKNVFFFFFKYTQSCRRKAVTVYLFLRTFLSFLFSGFGSLGTVLEGPIIGLVSTMYGWSGMFYLMIGLSLFGSTMVLKAAHTQKSQEKNAVFLEV